MDQHEELLQRYWEKKREVEELDRKVATGKANRIELAGSKSELEQIEKSIPGELLEAVRRGEIQENPEQPCDVLILTANPEDTVKLKIKEEIGIIRKHCSEGGLIAVPRFAGLDEIDKWVLLYRPRILHFAGHAGEWGTLGLENEAGNEAQVPAEAIVRLMKLQRWQLDGVVLNACWTEAAADPFLEISAYVVGMRTEIYDGVALKFADGFYRGLALGKKNVPDAFNWSLGKLGLHEIVADNIKLVPAKAGLPQPREDLMLPRSSTDAIEFEKVRGAHRNENDGNDESKRYPVWFGTDRAPVDAADFSKGFTGERAGELFYGKCEVSIPKRRKVSSVGSNFLKRLLKGDDRLNLEEIAMLKEAAFWQSMVAEINRVAGEENQTMAMVFVHGYNVSFDEAAIRAAQIGFDLALPGPMAFYSWPSKGKLTKYITDANTALGSAGNLAQFLRGFIAAMWGKGHKIHLLAHSMGNRLVLDAVGDLNNEFGTRLFDQIFLTAADVDKEKFEHDSPAFREIAQRATMYISSKDLALRASEFVNESDRAGYYEPVTVVSGVDTIRASRISQGLLGHDYYADAIPLLGDVKTLMWHDADPWSRERSWVQEVSGVKNLQYELRP